jgi:hypothetical protein
VTRRPARYVAAVYAPVAKLCVGRAEAARAAPLLAAQVVAAADVVDAQLRNCVRHVTS